jgi:hypothetical protein
MYKCIRDRSVINEYDYGYSSVDTRMFVVTSSAVMFGSLILITVQCQLQMIRLALVVLFLVVSVHLQEDETPAPHKCELKSCKAPKCPPGARLEKPVDTDGCFKCPICIQEDTTVRLERCPFASCKRCPPWCFGDSKHYTTAIPVDESGCSGCPVCIAQPKYRALSDVLDDEDAVRIARMQGSPCSR